MSVIFITQLECGEYGRWQRVMKGRLEPKEGREVIGEFCDEYSLLQPKILPHNRLVEVSNFGHHGVMRKRGVNTMFFWPTWIS